MTITVHAACHCKAFTLTISLDESTLPQKKTMCHCHSCRYRTGSLAVHSLNLPDAVDVDRFPTLKKYATVADSGRELGTWFCSVCGAKVLQRQLIPLVEGGHREQWLLAAGLLDRTEGVIQVVGHEYVDETDDGGAAAILTEINGAPLENWTGEEGTSARQDIKAIGAPDGERDPSLQMRCHCGALDVFVSRPSPKEVPAPNIYWYRPPRDAVTNMPTRYMASFCACESCRVTTGSSLPGAPWVILPLSELFKSPSLTDHWFDGEFSLDTQIPGLTQYHSSKEMSRYFCSKCGATAFWWNPSRTHLILMACGLARAKEGALAQSWFSWWCGQDGHPTPAMHCHEESLDSNYGQAMLEGLQRWGKNVGQRT